MLDQIEEAARPEEELLRIRRLPFPNLYHRLFRISLKITKYECRALVDTGAIASFISTNLFSKLSNKKVEAVPECRATPQFKSASGTRMIPLGYYSLPLRLNENLTICHPFYVVPQLDEGCILGVDFITFFKLNIDTTNFNVTLIVKGRKFSIPLEVDNQPIFSINEDDRNQFDLSHLPQDKARAVNSVLEKHRRLFANSMNQLGKTNIVKHNIDTKGEPFALHHYRTPITLRPLVKQHIDEMLDHGIIRPSTSPYRSPVVMVKKKTGDLRFCVDYRRLNSQTVKDKYPLPRIDDTLDYLHGARYFTTIDLFSGYWQIEIEEKDKFKTAFTSEFGHFEFNRMPFGLCNAPGTFQRLMESILYELLGNFVLVYIDDIIIYSKTWEEHMHHLDEIFSLLNKAGLKIKPSKCLFAKGEVQYLGHIVSYKGISPDDKKLEAINKYPSPKNVDQVRSYVGLASYYRRFIPDFAEKAHALTRLTRKDVSWQWGEAEQRAFDSIKKCLVTAPILGYPDFSRNFVIHTDASGYGVGAVLSQMQSTPLNPVDNEEPSSSLQEVVIAYTSKHLSESQTKWSATEKEAFAIIHAVRTFYHYLYGTDFTIVTDHRPLEYLMNKKDPTGRLARWSLFLQPFNLNIKYRPGKSNQNADSLSRAPVNAITVGLSMVDDWIAAQKEDTFCKEVFKTMAEETNATEQRGPQLRDISKDDGFIFLPNKLLANASGKIVVPAKLQKEIMTRYHDHKLAGHFGMTKTLSTIRAKYFWPRMIPQIQEHIRNCLFCAKRKAHTTCKAPLQPIPPSDYIFERIAMDIMGPLPESSRGHKYILVIMEYATKYVIATPMKDITSATVIKKLIKHVILKEGIPSVILTDRGTNFLSDDMKELGRQLGLKQVRTTAYHPQTDGLVENFNKTLADMLTAHVQREPQNWDIHLDYCISCYNQTVHISTKETPFFLIKGRDPLEPTDLRPPMRYRLTENEIMYSPNNGIKQ